MTTPTYTEVVSVPLTSNNTTTSFSLTNAPTKEYRFLHVHSFLNSHSLKIVSTKDKLPENYACLSYVWGGLPSLPENTNTDTSTIHVEGLSPSDNIPISMLRLICTVTQKLGIELLWMDKLCIRQDTPRTDKKSIGWQDKKWQMVQMYTIYHCCKVCLVAPGGMNRLPAIDERTSWIDRAWTLQEAIAPKDARVLFRWDRVRRDLQHVSFVQVEEVVEGVGMGELKGMLEASLKRDVGVVDPDVRVGDVVSEEEAKEERIEVNIFIERDEVTHPVMALLGALDHGEQDGRFNAIWRCLLMRQAKYREDMVFSVMGIMDAPVEGGDHDKDAKDYEEEKPTYELLIKFLKELVKKGRSAEWLGTAPQLGASTKHTGLPALPFKSNVRDDPNSGFESVIPPGSKYEIVRPKLTADRGGNDSWWWLKDSPAVKVLDTGDIELTVRAARVQESQELAEHKDYELQRDDLDGLVHCTTGRIWFMEHQVENSKAYAVYVGTKMQYMNGNLPMMVDPNSSLLMLISKNEDGKFENVGYAWGDEKLTEGWKESSFVVV